MLPFARFDLMRCHLKWAYERPLYPTQLQHLYIHQPTAAWLIRKGGIRIAYQNGLTEHFTTGEWIFPAHYPGEQKYDPGLEILSIRFQADWSYGEPLFPRHTTLRIPEAKVPELTRAAVALVEAVREHAHEEAGWKMKGEIADYWQIQRSFTNWLLQWHAAMLRAGAQPNRPDALDPKVRRALEWIEAQPLDCPLPESALAEKVGISVSQLNKLFTAHTGKTPAAFWQHRRREAAHARLIGSAESIKAIAYELGFSSPEYFTTWFRKHAGITPTALRRQHQSGEWV